MQLESELRKLDVEWPATPAFALALERRPRRRWPLAVALAAVLAVAAAFAVPQSRGAILRFLHLGGVEVRFVDTLPRAEERALGAGLGRPVTVADARSIVSGGLLLPPVDARLYADGLVVSVVFGHDGRPVLLSELPGGGGIFLKKLAAGETAVEPVTVGGDDGLWLAGARHVVGFPRRPPRLAGNVLLWEHGATTYRLEGPDLARSDAIRVALSLRRG
jgi:hypothetical protein